MELDKKLRYQSAAEVLADLDAEHVDRSLTLSIQRALSRRKGLVAAAAVVLAVGAAAFWVGRGGDTAAPIEGTPELISESSPSFRLRTLPTTPSWNGSAPAFPTCW